MAAPNPLVTLGIVSVLSALTFSSTAEAKKPQPNEKTRVTTLERWLLPDAIADRIQGSGVECRAIASAGGALHKLHVGFLRLNISRRVAVRAGIGMGSMAPLPLEAEHHGISFAGGASFAFWQRDGFSLGVEAGAMRARYAGGAAMNDATVTLAFRSR